ncbi:MAG: SPOR domain-containing protein [Alphaproteobacteria bacterium]
MMAPHRIRSWSRLCRTVLVLMAGAVVGSCAGGGPTTQAGTATAENAKGDPFENIDQNPVKSLKQIKDDAQRVAADLGLEGPERDVAVIQSQFDQIYPSLQRLLIIEEDIRKLLAILGDLPAEPLGLSDQDLTAGPQQRDSLTAASAPTGGADPVDPSLEGETLEIGQPNGSLKREAPSPTPPPALPAPLPDIVLQRTDAPPDAAGPPTPPPASRPRAPASAMGVPAMGVPDMSGPDRRTDPVPVEDIPIEDVWSPDAGAAAPAQPSSLVTDTAPWGVHLGTYGLKDSARRDLVLMRRDFGDALAGLTPRLLTLRARSKKRPLNRLILGPLASRAAAAALCSRLTARDRYCKPMLFEGSPF